MTHQLLFVQGGGKDTHDRWDNKLVESLERALDGAIVVGHSIGGTILLRTLADDPPTLKLGGIFLIAAPFVGKGGWPSDDLEPLSNVGRRLPKRTPVFIYHGRDDDIAPVGHVRLYSKAIPRAVVRRLAGRDHQLNNDLSIVAADIRRLVQA